MENVYTMQDYNKDNFAEARTYDALVTKGYRDADKDFINTLLPISEIIRERAKEVINMIHDGALIRINAIGDDGKNIIIRLEKENSDLMLELAEMLDICVTEDKIMIEGVRYNEKEKHEAKKEIKKKFKGKVLKNIIPMNDIVDDFLDASYDELNKKWK